MEGWLIQTAACLLGPSPRQRDEADVVTPQMIYVTPQISHPQKCALDFLGHIGRDPGAGPDFR